MIFEEPKTIRLSDFWDQAYHEHGIYALWQVVPLPNYGEYSNVKGINHCTAIYSDQKGFDVPMDHWLNRDDLDESRVSIRLLESLEEDDF